MLDFNVLEGKILEKCWNDGDEVHFVVSDDESYKLYHEQDCCEGVFIEDICGDLADLVGEPLLLVEESSNCTDPPRDPGEDSYTWTFYKFATVKGYVTVRWYGQSNGYYSERVDFVEVLEPLA